MTRPKKGTFTKTPFAVLLLACLGGCSSGNWDDMFWNDGVYQSDPHLSDIWWSDLQKQKANGGTW